MQERVIIVGGGFGGLTAAVRLARLRKGRKDFRVTLIDKSAAHLYYPLIYEVATGWFRSEAEDDVRRTRERRLKEGASIGFDALQRPFRRRGIEILDAEAVGLDAGASKLLLADGRELGYAHAVIALGSVPNDFGIEGMAEHAHFLYSMRGALAIRRRVRDLVTARRRNEIPHIHVVVGGAGATGVEFACELAGLFSKLERKGELRRSDWTIEVVEAGSRPLGAFPEDLSRWALRRMERLGIKVFLDTCVKGAHKDHLILMPRPLRDGEKSDDLLCDFRKENEKEITHDLFVWTGGSRSSPGHAKLGLPLDAKGRVETGEDLRVRGHRNLWVIGDGAGLTDPKTGRAVPPLAQAAIAEGKTVAENIVSVMRGGETRPYGFPKMAIAVPLGGMYGIADVYGLHVKGRIVYFLKLAAEARYFFKTFPFTIAWKMMLRIMKAYRKND